MTGIKDSLAVDDNAKIQLVRGEPEYEPKLLGNKEQFDLYWPQAAVLIEKCLRDAARGELTVEDIYERALHGQMFVFVFKNDEGDIPDVKLALVLEAVNYPKLPALNIVALTGGGLKNLYEQFWKHVCSWAYMSGAKAIEGLMSPAMVKIVSKFGFENTYQHMRFDLEGAIKNDRL